MQVSGSERKTILAITELEGALIAAPASIPRRALLQICRHV